MRPWENIKFEDLPALLWKLDGDLKEIGTQASTLQMIDHYQSQFDIILNWPTSNYISQFDTAVQRLNTENEGILEFIWIKASKRPIGVAQELMWVDERYAMESKQQYRAYLDGKTANIVPERLKEFIGFSEQGLSETEVEDIMRNRIQDRMQGSLLGPDTNTFQNQFISWEPLDEVHFLSFLKGVEMLWKNINTPTKNIVIWIIQGLNAKLHFWFFEHAEGTDEFIRALPLFKKIIELDRILEINALPRWYKRHFQEKSLEEYISLLALGIDEESPNYNLSTIKSDDFLLWLKSVHKALSEMKRGEAQWLKNNSIRFVLSILENRAQSHVGENWSLWEVKIRELK